jgi:uncharacterized protein YuzE
MKIKCEYDREADAIYVHLNDKPYAYGKDLDDGRRIDYASDHTPIGIELIGVSKGVEIDDFPIQNEVIKCLREYDIKVFAK